MILYDKEKILKKSNWFLLNRFYIYKKEITSNMISQFVDYCSMKGIPKKILEKESVFLPHVIARTFLEENDIDYFSFLKDIEESDLFYRIKVFPYRNKIFENFLIHSLYKGEETIASLEDLGNPTSLLGPLDLFRIRYREVFYNLYQTGPVTNNNGVSSGYSLHVNAERIRILEKHMREGSIMRAHEWSIVYDNLVEFGIEGIGSPEEKFQNNDPKTSFSLPPES